MKPRQAPPAIALALLIGGCGGSAASATSGHRRELLRDVPELAAAYEGGGGQGGGSSRSEGARSGGGGAVRSSARSVGGGGGNRRLEGEFGGPDRAAELSDECVGYIASEPNHQLYFEPEGASVHLAVSSDPFDTTLVVELSDGTYVCNDDSEGLNPAVWLEPIPDGLVRIWVGSFSAGQRGPYRMQVTITPDDEPLSDH